MSSRVIYFEIHADDTARARKFYGDLFGWKFEKFGGGMDYWSVETGPDKDPGINGGLLKRPGDTKDDECTTAFVCTVSVADFDKYADRIVDAGGTIAHEKMAVPKMGWAGYFKDTEGNHFGIFQPDPKAK